MAKQTDVQVIFKGATTTKQDVARGIAKAIKSQFVKTWLLIIEDDYVAGVSVYDGTYKGQNSESFWQIDEATQKFAIVQTHVPALIVGYHLIANTLGYNDGYLAFSAVAKWLPQFDYELTDWGENVQEFLKWRDVMCFSSNHTTDIAYHLEFAIERAQDIITFALAHVPISPRIKKEHIIDIMNLEQEFRYLNKQANDATIIMSDMLDEIENILSDILPDVLIAGPVWGDNSWGIMSNLDDYPLLAELL